MSRDDDRLGAGFAEEVPRVEAVVGEHGGDVSGGDERGDRRQIEAGGEEPAVAEDDADAQMVGVGQAPVRPRHGLDHVEIPQVVRVRAVDTDEEQPAVLVDGHDVGHGISRLDTSRATR